MKYLNFESYEPEDIPFWVGLSEEDFASMWDNFNVAICENIYHDMDLLDYIPKSYMGDVVRTLFRFFFMEYKKIEYLFNTTQDYINIYIRMAADVLEQGLYTDDYSDEFYENFVLKNIEQIIYNQGCLENFIKLESRIDKDLAKRIMFTITDEQRPYFIATETVLEFFNKFDLKDTYYFLKGVV